MDRWTGVVKTPIFNLTASLLFSPSSKTLIAPSINAIFFNGDRVRGTGNPVIERLSDSGFIAQLLVSKLGSSANAWVFEAERFNGPFAVYREFVPSVDSMGDPKGYDPDGFPASVNVASVLCEAVQKIKSVLSSMPTESAAAGVLSSATPPETALPKTIILGFSKGGIVLNQIIAELAHMEPQSSYTIQDHVCPISKDELLSTISEIHYIDVGLNRTGAYLTDKSIIKKAVENLLVSNDRVRFILHGTPRQWCDKNRPWICKEKDFLLKLLNEEAQRSEGKLQAIERKA
ncbi:uncharacterized protein A4U43_C04F32420 [Asparagus officinalis]|uniref:Uncharacterized protein n=1 Tax=Asparagus officinalis TaxID=4686 RepID=A0A5P1F5Y2_ASPOF|nr:uncharacterized protein A4U43_C04F32420 [Asparagus officinalis]